MLKLSQTTFATRNRIDAAQGVIYGVCVARCGEAKGHGVSLDDGSLETLLALTKGRENGVATRFGNDHQAASKDFNGSLKDFRIQGDGIYADLHLLKTDAHYDKLLEMAERIPNEFGLSVVADAAKTKDGKNFKSPIRFEALDCVDIVSAPAATNGLFFSQPNTNTIMLKEFALMLGLPDTATEADVKLALEAKCKYESEHKKKMEAEAEAEEEAKKKLEAEEEAKKKKMEADDEEKGKDKSKKLEAEIEALKLAVANITKAADEKAAELALAAKKAEVENIKLEAGKEGKVIALTDEAILKLSVDEFKAHVAQLPKNQIKLNKGNVNTEAQPKFDAAAAREARKQGAIALGQRMTNQLTLNK